MYSLNRTVPVNQSDAKANCERLGMHLIDIRTLEEQSTLCFMLASAVGSVPFEGYWLAMTRFMSGSGPWLYSNSQAIAGYECWDPDVSLGDPGQCSLVVGGFGNFRWMPFECEFNASDNDYSFYALCGKSGG